MFEHDIILQLNEKCRVDAALKVKEGVGGKAPVQTHLYTLDLRSRGLENMTNKNAANLVTAHDSGQVLLVY